MHLEGEIIELHNFHGYYEQRWNVIHVEDIYYKIISQYSDLALTAPTGPNNDVVTQTTYTGDRTHLWKFIERSDGTYKISPKSNSNYFMAAGDISSTADQDLEIRNAQSDGGDRWYSLKMDGTEAMFLAVTDTGHDHHSVFGEITEELVLLGYNDFNYVITDNISIASVQSKISNAKIYVSRSHGGRTANGTYICLGGQNLKTSDIYDYNTNTAIINLTNCDLMLFVACETAANPTQSLPDAAVAAGAKAAVGFIPSINCTDGNEWVKNFFVLHAAGMSVSNAAYQATISLGQNNPSTYIRVVQ